jgi:DNA-binding ferritin-like protein
MNLLSAISNLIILRQGLYSIHWNLVDPQFLTIHQFTDEQIEKLDPLIDQLAERVRATGLKIPTSLSDLYNLKTVNEICLFNSSPTAQECLLWLWECAGAVSQFNHQTMNFITDLGTQEILIRVDQYLTLQLWFIQSMGICSSVPILEPSYES